MIYYPFDSKQTGSTPAGLPIYDRAVNSEVLRNLYKAFYTNGVIPIPSMGFAVTPGTGMNLKVSPGKMFIDGVLAYETSERTIALEASDPSLDIIARVVVRKNDNVEARNVDLYVIYGDASLSPQAPAVTRQGSIYEMALCDVFISRGVTEIKADRITDQRMNEELCGICAGTLKEVDTTTIFNQFQGALDEYLELVNSAIDGTLASQLQTEINDIKEVQEITLSTTWSDGLQTVSVEGITENDSPILDVKLSGDFDTVLEQQAEWNKIVQATTGNGTITFLSSEDTTMQLTILVKGK